MTTFQQILTIAAVVLGTVLTRFLAFLLFPEHRKPPAVIEYLGSVLPCAVMGLLVVYSLKDVSLLQSPHGIPEAIAIVFIILLHLLKKNMFLSIAGGTILYMFLVQVIF